MTDDLLKIASEMDDATFEYDLRSWAARIRACVSDAERETVRGVVAELQTIVDEEWTRMDEQVCKTLLSEMSKWIIELRPIAEGGKE